MQEKIYYHKQAKISYLLHGKGKGTIVFLHGFLEDKSLWAPYSNFFSTKYKIVAIDLLGHGESDCIGYIHTMEEQSDMVYGLLNSLGICQAHLIGHSMGGYISLAFLEKYPKAVQSIGLLNSTTIPDSKERLLNRNRAIKMVQKNHNIFVRMAIPNLFVEKEKERNSAPIAQLITTAKKMKPQGILAAIEGMKMRKDHTETLLKYTGIKWIVAGDKDLLIPLESLQQISAFARVPLHVLDGGHMLPVTSTASFVSEIKDYYN